MSQTEQKLDQLLADLAEDVPPMPAEFHQRWTDAVAREAAGPAKTEIGKPARGWRVQGRHLLGVAAVFVFLIGGTLIYRSARGPVLPQPKAASLQAVLEEEAVLKVETASEEDCAAGAEAPSEGTYDSGAIREEVTVEAKAAYEAMAAESLGAGSPETEEMAEAEEAADGTAAPMSTEPMAAGVPEAPAETETRTAGERRGLGGFWTDMGDFLGAIWPYLLIVLIPAAVAGTVKINRRKR